MALTSQSRAGLGAALLPGGSSEAGCTRAILARQGAVAAIGTLLLAGTALLATPPEVWRYGRQGFGMSTDFLASRLSPAVSGFPVENSQIYLYLSFHGKNLNHPYKHGGVNQIYRYSIGTIEGDQAAPDSKPFPVLDAGSWTLVGPMQELRGMVLGSDGKLFVANGWLQASAILRFAKCDVQGIRRYEAGYVTKSLVHPYGLAVDQDMLFATTQDTGSIVGVNVTEPCEDAKCDARFQTYLQSKDVEFRGVANHEGCLFVADKKMHAVHVLCHGRELAKIPAMSPIGVHADAESMLLFVGSTEKDDPHIACHDLRTYELVRRIRHPSMMHPAGIAVLGSRLFVATQIPEKKVLEFDAVTGDFRRDVVTGLDDTPEQLMISPC